MKCYINRQLCASYLFVIDPAKLIFIDFTERGLICTHTDEILSRLHDCFRYASPFSFNTLSQIDSRCLELDSATTWATTAQILKTLAAQCVESYVVYLASQVAAQSSWNLSRNPELALVEIGY